MVNEIFVFVRSPPAERTLHGGDTYQFSFLLLFESIIYRLLSLRPFASNPTMFSDCYPSRTLANYATPGQRAGNVAIPARNGLIMVRLSYYLPMYCFYFHLKYSFCHRPFYRNIYRILTVLTLPYLSPSIFI